MIFPIDSILKMVPLVNFGVPLAIFRARMDSSYKISNSLGHQFWNTIRSEFLLDDARFTRILNKTEFLILIASPPPPATFVVIFHILSDRLLQRILRSELSLTFNILFVYHIVYCFSISFFCGLVPDSYPPRAPIDLILMLWLVKKLFLCPLIFQVF